MKVIIKKIKLARTTATMTDHGRDTTATLEYSQKFAHARSSRRNVHHCKICPYFSTSVFIMVNHVRRHRSQLTVPFNCARSKVEKYHCTDCNFQTNLTFLFKKHLQEQHSTQRESQGLPIKRFTIKKYKCQNCNFETHFFLKRLQHYATCPDNGNTSSVLKRDKWYYCKKCSFRAITPYYVRRHAVIHVDGEVIKRHRCQHCPFRTKYKNSLIRHVYKFHAMERQKKAPHKNDSATDNPSDSEEEIDVVSPHNNTFSMGSLITNATNAYREYERSNSHRVDHLLVQCEQHRSKEQQRRSFECALFNSLKATLPGLHLGTRVSRTVILQRASTYCRNLTYTEQKLKQQKKAMMKWQLRLFAALSKLQALD